MVWKKKNQTKLFSIKNLKIFYFVDALFNKLKHCLKSLISLKKQSFQFQQEARG